MARTQFQASLTKRKEKRKRSRLVYVSGVSLVSGTTESRCSNCVIRNPFLSVSSLLSSVLYSLFHEEEKNRSNSRITFILWSNSRRKSNLFTASHSKNPGPSLFVAVKVARATGNLSQLPRRCGALRCQVWFTCPPGSWRWEQLCTNHIFWDSIE